MKALLFLSLFLSAIRAGAQIGYDPAQLTQWQQDGAWEQILAAARSAERADIRLLNAAGFAAYQTGDHASALDWYERSLAADSNNRSTLYYLALMYKNDDRETAAIPLLVRLCRQVPDNAGYHQLLGDCYTEQNQPAAAADAYRRAYKLVPGVVGVAVKLAAALQQATFPNQADTVLRAAMRRNPATPALINGAIQLAYNQKQYARCAMLCDSLIATGKMNFRSMLSGMYADIARADFRHATKLGDILIGMDAATEDVLYYKAIAHQKLGEWKAADTLLQLSVRKMVKNELKDAYVALAEGAEAQGNFQKSRSYYDTAYYLFRNPELLYRAGSMLEAHGLKAAAKPVFRRYLALPAHRQDTAVSRYLKQRLSETQ